MYHFGTENKTSDTSDKWKKQEPVENLNPGVHPANYRKQHIASSEKTFKPFRLFGEINSLNNIKDQISAVSPHVCLLVYSHNF